MKHNFELPAIMQHLPLDERGYPIPYFVAIVNGKPDFRYQDPNKRDVMIERKVCFICGKRLYDKSFWFITGPAGLLNQIGSDAPMHEDCARFTLTACPHLVFQRADRREDDEVTPVTQENAGLVKQKPMVLYLVKADKVDHMTVKEHQGKKVHVYFKFRTLKDKTEKYGYHEGRLTRIVHDADDKKIVIPMTLYGMLGQQPSVTLEGLEYAVLDKSADHGSAYVFVRKHDKKVFIQKALTEEGVLFTQLN